MDIKEIIKLKEKLIPDTKKFLISITKELLNSKVKNTTLNPTLITHKEFIDTSLAKLIKKIKEKLIQLAKQKNLPVGDKIFEVKLEYLAGYLLKYDIANEKYIHKTIAKYILNLIRKDYLKLNYFVSTLNKDVYQGKYGKYKYPILYPYDKHKYNNPIPPLKQLLNKIDTVKKALLNKEELLAKHKQELETALFEINQIKISATDMKDIVSSLKNKYQDKPLKDRLMMIKQQHSRFNVLLTELKDKVASLKKEIASLEKNIKGFKEKYKDILSKEEEIIDTIATNLSQMKIKV
jgi:hypothetical protein